MNTSFSTIQQPQSLPHWQQQLKPLALPVAPAVKQAALQKLRSRSGNAVNVAQIIATDPVLILRLVHNANKYLMRSGNEVTSLSHAISLLGVPRTEQLLREAPEYDPEHVGQLGEFRRQLNISRHAAVQLQGWAAHNPHWAGDELFIAAVLQRAPMWALWLQAPDLMQRLRRIEARAGGYHEVIEKRELGCTIQTLAATLSRQWHLPRLTQLSWFPSERGHPHQWILLSRIIPEKAREALERFPELQRLATSKAFAVALANRLARESDWDWYSNRSRRLQKLLANSSPMRLTEAIALTHQLAAAASREQADTSLITPGSQLLCYYRRRDDIPPDVSQPATAPTATAQLGETRPVISRAVLELINQLRNQPQQYHSLHNLLNLAVQRICRDIHFERACASLLHPASGELRTYFSCGCDDSPGLKQFHHPLQPGDLFQRLLQSPAGVQLREDNRDQFWSILPDTFKQACGTNQFVMMSIFAGKKPLGLIYADCGRGSHPVGDQQYAVFKQLCAAINSCLNKQVRAAAKG